MKLHKEAQGTLLMIGAALIAINCTVFILLPAILALFVKCLIVLVSILIFLFFVQFFRNPDVAGIVDENSVVAPADGKIVVVEETDEKEYFKDRRIQISIFMSPVNVHVNRNPISGIVKHFMYYPGKFLVAWHPKSSTQNERTSIVIGHPVKGDILFRQIAGALARRIVWYVKEGQEVKQSEEFGFIKFGSRVDVFLPLDAKVLVKPGDKTKGGVTVLAQI